jgi:hypothetical protein
MQFETNNKGRLMSSASPISFLRRNRFMQWSEVNFGKHKGKSLPQILFNDADWFFHAYENGYFSGVLAQEAHELYRKARSIPVPQRDGQQMLVEYVIHQELRTENQKFGTMRLIGDGPGLERLFVSSSIDFYLPRQYAKYDKTGYKNFVFALKMIFFGNPSHRMNRQACEDFFNNLN